MSATAHQRRRQEARVKVEMKQRMDEEFQAFAATKDAPQVKADWAELMADSTSDAVLLVMRMKLAELKAAPMVTVPPVSVDEEGLDDTPPDIPEDWQAMRVGEMKSLARKLDPAFEIVGTKKADAVAVVEAALQARGAETEE